MARVEQSVIIAAKPERVWQAWIGEISHWWKGPYFVDRSRATGLVIEPQLGGRFMETWDDQGSGYLVGQVIEWLPPRRFAFTWMEKAWQGISTVVWVEVQPEGRGTRVTLVHEGFERLPDAAGQRGGYDKGWADLLDKFKTYIEQG